MMQADLREGIVISCYSMLIIVIGSCYCYRVTIVITGPPVVRGTVVVISKMVVADGLLARGGSLIRRRIATETTAMGRLGDVVGMHSELASSGRTSAAEDARNWSGLVPAGTSAHSYPSLKFPTATYCYIRRLLRRCYLAVASYS